MASPASCRSSCVKLYLCSNPEDSVVERKALREGVFPRFREHCRHALGLDVRVIDPFESCDRGKWPDDNTRKQMIKDCRDSSVGPYLLALVGHEYGTVALPSQVEVSEYQALLQESQRSGVSTHQLEKVYSRDENSIPPSYCLKSQAEIEHPDECRNIFETALHLCVLNNQMTPEKAQGYCRSDLRNALEDKAHKDISGRCLIYIHKVLMIGKEKSSQQPKSEDLAMSSLLSPEALLSSLCDDFLLGLIAPHNLLMYTTTSECPHGFTTARRRCYAESLCHQANSDLVKLMESLDARNHGPEPLFREVFAREQAEQQEVCKILSGFYEISRPEEDEIRKYVQSEQWRPLLITGGPCTGKTVLLAHCSHKIKSWLPDCDPVVIPFFCCFSLTPSPEHLLSSLCYQITKSYQSFSSQQDPPNSENSEQSCCNKAGNLDVSSNDSCLDYRLYTEAGLSITELKQHISTLTSSLPSQKHPLIIVINGLAHMDLSYGVRVIEQLPSPLPPGVKVLLTASSTRKHIVQAVELHYPRSTTLGSESEDEEPGFVCLELAQPNRKESVKMLASWLCGCGRKITSGQQALVNQALTSQRRPLYTRLLHRQASVWQSDSEVTASTLPDGVHSSISVLLDHLELKHGFPLVAHAVCYLTLSRTGLTEAELADLLSNDNEVLAVYMKPCDGHLPKLRVPQADVEKLILDLKPFLNRRTVANVVVLFWVSRHFELVVSKKYLDSSAKRSEFHSDMADYYSGRWSCGCAKPFDQDNSETKIYIDRQPSSQPFIFTPSSTDVGNVNLKKILELPYHLKESGRLEELRKLILTLDFHQAMVRAGLLVDLVAMLEKEGEFLKEHALLASILRSSTCFLNDFPLDLPSVMELNFLPFKNVFPDLEGYASAVQLERKKREVGVVHHPAPSTVHTFKCVKSQGKLREAAVTQCGTAVQIMENGSVWVCRSDNMELTKLTLSNEHEDIQFCNLKSSGHFILLSSLRNKHFLWDVDGAEFLLEVKDPNGTPKAVENVCSCQEEICIQWKDEDFVSTVEISSGSMNHFHCQNTVTCVAYSSEVLLCGQDEGTVSIFDTNAKRLLRICSNPNQKTIVSIFTSHHKQQIGAIDQTGNISLWDISKEVPQIVKERLLDVKFGDVLATDYSREIHALLVCQSRQVTLWDTWEWDVNDQFIAPNRMAFGQALLSPDGHFLLALLDKSSVLVWRLSNGECILSLGTCQPPYSLFKSPSDIICVSTDGSISSWDSDMIYAAGISRKMSHRVREVVIEQDGDGFYSCDGSEMVWKWSLETGQPCAYLLHNDPVEKMRLSPNNTHLVTLSSDDIYIWQTGSGQNVMRIRGSKASDIFITTNSNFGVSLSDRGISRVWKLVSGATICTIHRPLSDAQISAESTFLIGLNGGELLAASLWSGTIHKRFSCNEVSEIAAFQTLAKHPNFVIVLLTSGSLYTWNVAEETVFRHLKIPKHYQLKEFQMCSNGSYALLSTCDSKLTILDLFQFRICSYKTNGVVVKACLDPSGCYAICCTRKESICQCYLHTRPTLAVIRMDDGSTVGSLYLPKNPTRLAVEKQNWVFVGFEDGAVGVYYFVEQPVNRIRRSQMRKCPFDQTPTTWLSLIAPNVVWS